MNLIDNVGYRWYFIQNYEAEGHKGAMVLISHHTYTDGVNLFPVLTALTNEKDFSTLLKVNPPSMWMQLMQ